MWSYLLGLLLISLAINGAMFLVAYKRGTDKLTDASYAITFIVLATYGLLRAPLNPLRVIIWGMITVWAIRLGGFLLFRIWKTGKDGRFDAMRGNFWKFGKFWVSQGLAVWTILIPSLLILHYQATTTLHPATYVGVGVWLAGFLIESIADLQKYRFSSNPKNTGQWIATGLWGLSRHPNYFGEILVWVGVYIYACAVLPLPAALIGASSPLFIISLLLFVSGIPILEKSADNRWGKLAAYNAYKRRTSILIILPPKK